MNEKESLLASIHEQNILPEEVSLWEEMLQDMPNHYCYDILNFIQSEQNGLRILTDNLKIKVNALRTQDSTKWEEVFKLEKNFLETLSK